MEWYVLYRRGNDVSITRAPSEDAAITAAGDLYRRGALIEEIGMFHRRRRKVVLRGMAAMARMQSLTAPPCGAA